MGMVKVQDQIEVNFEILFEVISGDWQLKKNISSIN
jgi:hypothetical protein